MNPLRLSRSLFSILLACALSFAIAACGDDDESSTTTSPDTSSSGADTSSSGTDDTSSSGADTSSSGTDTSSSGTDTSSSGTDTSSSGTDTTPEDTDTNTGPSAACVAYCDLMEDACGDVFADEAACLLACEDFPTTGDPNTTSGDSVECRAYHANVASLGDAAFHCPHASPEGGGVCTDTPAPTECDRYCTNFFEGCGPEGLNVDLDLLYPDRDTCISTCHTFDHDGTFGDTTGDTLQCRDYYAQLSTTDVAGRPSHCLAARADGGGVCVGSDAGLQIDRMGRPGIATALIAAPNKDAYNRATPAEGEFFSGDIRTFLGVYDGLDGANNAILPAIALAPVLANDVLLFRADIDNCAGGYLAVELASLTGAVPAACGGRTLSQDVMDLTLQALVHFPDPITLQVSDDVPANDLAFPGTFPYLADPHP